MRAEARARSIYVAILSLLMLSLVLGKPAPAVSDIGSAASAEPLFEPGEVLVAYKPGPSAVTLDAAARDTVLRDYRATRIGEVFGLDVDIVAVAEGRELDTIRALSKDPRVLYAEPNYIYHAFTTPDDPYYSYQWAYANIQAPAAWDIVTGTTSIIIAVIDSGIDETHPDLATKIVPGYDYVDDDSYPQDFNGHGTHVAGIAAAVTNNGVGIAGTSWGATIMPMRVLDAAGDGSSADVASAIGWARLSGAKIINLSLGGTFKLQTLQDAITGAYNDGLLIVASMGNAGNGTLNYPAAYDNVMAVSATDENDVRAYYSNYGEHNDIAAPGGVMYCHASTGIYSTLPTYDVTLNHEPTCNYYRSYDFMQGTSQAAPFVSGLAALIWSMRPGFTPGQVQQTIEDTAVDLGTEGWDIIYGHGRIDALAAVESLIVLPAPTLLPISNPEQDGEYWVDWSDVPYATSYTLEEDDNPSFSSPTIRYSGSSSTVLVTGRPFGVWYYRVKATRLSAGKLSPWSNVESVEVGLGAPLLGPIVNNGASSYEVAWQSVSGATGYRLQESGVPNFSSAITYTLGLSLTYDVTGQVGGTWYYRVQAYNSWGASNWSTVQSTTVLPEAPTLYHITSGGEPDAYTLSWSNPTGATGYRLQESLDLLFTNPVTRYLGTATTFSVTGQPNGRWYYRAQAYNQAGFSPSSVTRDITVTVPLVPAPTIDEIDNSDGDDAYTVSWNQILTATDYTLEQSLSAYLSPPTVAYTGPLTQHSVTGQTPGPWHYRVRAHTAAGSSPWSATASVIVPGYAYLPMVMRNSSP